MDDAKKWECLFATDVILLGSFERTEIFVKFLKKITKYFSLQHLLSSNII